MASFKYQTSSNSYPEEILSYLKSDISPDLLNVAKIVSGADSEFVHVEILRRVNVFLHDLLSLSKCCENNVLILSYSPPGTLSNLVALLYAGQVSGLSKIQTQQVLKLANVLEINITTESKDIRGTASTSISQINKVAREDSEDENERNESHRTELKIQTKKINKFGNLILSFPKSRSNRQKLKKIKQSKENLMSGFQARVQTEYNKHPVGMYMGPYDQNKNLELKIQLPDSNLNFQNYTQFHHEGHKCFALKIKSYEKYDILEKIDAYRITKEIVSDNESASDSESSQEGDRRTYTCQFRTCKIPCPCPQCHLDQPPCFV